jgi:polyhydroxyalkanoate synthesis regulator phasin
MRQDAWRAYLEMALGVTEASGKKALKTAKRLVGKSGVSAEQLQGMADELVRASAANREAVRNLVRVELERALNAVGLAKSDDVETLTARVRELEAQLQATKVAAPAGADSGPVPSSLAAPAKTTVAKKAVAKKAVAAPADAAE